MEDEFVRSYIGRIFEIIARIKSYEIRTTLEVKLKNWYCAFQDARMMEDESVRSYVGRISEIFVAITSHNGKKLDNEKIWKILKSLTPPSKLVAQMIQ